jgi:hypothetical protein
MHLKPLCLMLITDQAWQLEVVVIYVECCITSVQLCNASLLIALQWALRCSLVRRSACAPPILRCPTHTIVCPAHHGSCIHWCASTRCTWCIIDSGLIVYCYPPPPKWRCECVTLQRAYWHLVRVGVVRRNVSGARGAPEATGAAASTASVCWKVEQRCLTHVRAAASGAWAAASAHPTACSPGDPCWWHCCCLWWWQGRIVRRAHALLLLYLCVWAWTLTNMGSAAAAAVAYSGEWWWRWRICTHATVEGQLVRKGDPG